MEPFHSEYKTDLDLERLPSGTFATNQLILSVALLVFNLLRVMGQATLDDPLVPLRKRAQRRRLKTVMYTTAEKRHPFRMKGAGPSKVRGGRRILDSGR